MLTVLYIPPAILVQSSRLCTVQHHYMSLCNIVFCHSYHVCEFKSLVSTDMKRKADVHIVDTEWTSSKL